MNLHAIKAIIFSKWHGHSDTVTEHVSPVIYLSLFCGFRHSHRITHPEVDGVAYGLHRARPDHAVCPDAKPDQCVLWHLFPKFMGTIYELMSAPVSPFEAVLGYAGAAATKSLMIGLIIRTAHLFVPIQILHPVWMIGFLVLTCVSFAMFGFIIGIWAQNFEQLNLIPMLIITLLVFLGAASFHRYVRPCGKRSPCSTRSCIFSGFRWPFSNRGCCGCGQLGAICSFMLVCLAVIWWISSPAIV